MSYHTESFNRYVDQNRDRFLAEFGQFIAQVSVAADMRGVPEMAEAGAAALSPAWRRSHHLPTPGSPMVYAEIGPKDAARTLLIYNHYDVQPEDPLELWNSKPFEMTIKDGVIYGRGTSDDKGELLSRIQAVEAWLNTQGELPIRIKWLVEGEEETGSVNLEAWVKQHAAICSEPTACCGKARVMTRRAASHLAWGGKGLAYFELHCQGPNHDLHSSLAPMVVNPAWRLVWALSTLKDANDTITLDGYLEHSRPLTEAEPGPHRRDPDGIRGHARAVGDQGLAQGPGRHRRAPPLSRRTDDHDLRDSLRLSVQGSKTVLPSRRWPSWISGWLMA